jgi:hypothetical protein
VKVPRAKSDAYVFFEVSDMKFSLHDPALSKERPPWQIGLTEKHFESDNPLRTPDRRLIEAWGPVGSLPPLMYAALQILMPGSEFADRTGWGEPAADVSGLSPSRRRRSPS